MNRELERWFLESGERGNPATSIRAWTVGNLVEALVHGRTWRAGQGAAVALAPVLGALQ